jgi:hypothetical protein
VAIEVELVEAGEGEEEVEVREEAIETDRRGEEAFELNSNLPLYLSTINLKPLLNTTLTITSSLQYP